MCNGSVLMFRTFARGMGLPLDCHMPGMCRRIYSSAVMGEPSRPVLKSCAAACLPRAVLT